MARVNESACVQCTEDGAGGAAFGKHLTRRTVLLDCHSHAGWSSLQVPGTRSARVLGSGSLSNLKQLACQILTALHRNGVKCPISSGCLTRGIPGLARTKAMAGIVCLILPAASCAWGMDLRAAQQGRELAPRWMSSRERPVGTQAARNQDSSPLGSLGKITIFLSSNGLL